MNFIEDAKLSGVRFTADGYLTAEVRCARSGIQHYTGDELGRADLSIVALYRPENQVFAKDSIKSYVGRPVTNNHPHELVDATNWKEHAVGGIGEEVLRDGEYVRVPITLMDKNSIDDVKSGKREVSMGYTQNIVWEDGETPEGEPYQAIAKNLRMNHLAIVERGRAGHECRVGDNADNQWGVAPVIPQQEVKPMSEKLTTVAVDGLSVITTDQGAQAIQKLQKTIEVHDSIISSKDSDHALAIAAKDKELGQKDTEIADLKEKQVSASDLDKLAQDRADLIGDAKLLSKDSDFSGKSDNEIRVLAVESVRGEDSMKDKPEAYVQGAFDAALDKAKRNQPANKVANDLKTVDHGKPADNGQAGYEQRLNDGWKTEGEK